MSPAPSYLVLSAELPGEGVWCSATTYAQLVQCVQQAWGGDFVCIFKYKLMCDAAGAAEQERLCNAYAHMQRCLDARDTPLRTAQKEGADGDSTTAKVQCRNAHATAVCATNDSGNDEGDDTTTRRSHTCDVVIDDESDFALWYGGGGALTLCAHCTDDVTHHASYHAVDHDAALPLTRTVYAHRKTTHLDAVAAAHLTCDRDVRMQSYHSYYHVYTNKDGVYRYRSSPAVRSSADDVVGTPRYALVPPSVSLRLQLAVVLRHSNASEVILCARQGNCQHAHGLCGVGSMWGMLLRKAQSAWGVHMPLFAYTDTTRGLMRMYISNCTQFDTWTRTVARDGANELLVVEQDIPASRCADRAVVRAVMCYRATHPNMAIERADAYSDLGYLSAKLCALQHADNMSSVTQQRRHVYEEGDNDSTNTRTHAQQHTRQDTRDAKSPSLTISDSSMHAHTTSDDDEQQCVQQAACRAQAHAITTSSNAPCPNMSQVTSTTNKNNMTNKKHNTRQNAVLASAMRDDIQRKLATQVHQQALLTKTANMHKVNAQAKGAVTSEYDAHATSDTCNKWRSAQIHTQDEQAMQYANKTYQHVLRQMTKQRLYRL